MGPPIFSKFSYVSLLGIDRVVEDIVHEVMDTHMSTTSQNKLQFSSIKMKAGVLAIYPECCCVPITDTMLVHKSCGFKGIRYNCQIIKLTLFTEVK